LAAYLSLYYAAAEEEERQGGLISLRGTQRLLCCLFAVRAGLLCTMYALHRAVCGVWVGHHQHRHVTRDEEGRLGPLNKVEGWVGGLSGAVLSDVVCLFDAEM
jgi:hypothetical protein